MGLGTEEFGLRIANLSLNATGDHSLRCSFTPLPDVSSNVIAMLLIFSSRSNDNYLGATFQNVFSLQFKTFTNFVMY